METFHPTVEEVPDESRLTNTVSSAPSGDYQSQSVMDYSELFPSSETNNAKTSGTQPPERNKKHHYDSNSGEEGVRAVYDVTTESQPSPSTSPTTTTHSRNQKEETVSSSSFSPSGSFPLMPSLSTLGHSLVQEMNQFMDDFFQKFQSQRPALQLVFDTQQQQSPNYSTYQSSFSQQSPENGNNFSDVQQRIQQTFCRYARSSDRFRCITRDYLSQQHPEWAHRLEEKLQQDEKTFPVILDFVPLSTADKDNTQEKGQQSYEVNVYYVNDDKELQRLLDNAQKREELMDPSRNLDEQFGQPDRTEVVNAQEIPQIIHDTRNDACERTGRMSSDPSSSYRSPSPESTASAFSGTFFAEGPKGRQKNSNHPSSSFATKSNVLPQEQYNEKEPYTQSDLSQWSEAKNTSVRYPTETDPKTTNQTFASPSSMSKPKTMEGGAFEYTTKNDPNGFKSPEAYFPESTEDGKKVEGKGGNEIETNTTTGRDGKETSPQRMNAQQNLSLKHMRNSSTETLLAFVKNSEPIQNAIHKAYGIHLGESSGADSGAEEDAQCLQLLSSSIPVLFYYLDTDGTCLETMIQTLCHTTKTNDKDMRDDHEWVPLYLRDVCVTQFFLIVYNVVMFPTQTTVNRLERMMNNRRGLFAEFVKMAKRHNSVVACVQEISLRMKRLQRISVERAHKDLTPPENQLREAYTSSESYLGQLLRAIVTKSTRIPESKEEKESHKKKHKKEKESKHGKHNRTRKEEDDDDDDNDDDKKYKKEKKRKEKHKLKSSSSSSSSGGGDSSESSESVSSGSASSVDSEDSYNDDLEDDESTDSESVNSEETEKNDDDDDDDDNDDEGPKYEDGDEDKGQEEEDKKAKGGTINEKRKQTRSHSSGKRKEKTEKKQSDTSSQKKGQKPRSRSGSGDSAKGTLI
jgi:hypothetical protein